MDARIWAAVQLLLGLGFVALGLLVAKDPSDQSAREFLIGTGMLLAGNVMRAPQEDGEVKRLREEVTALRAKHSDPPPPMGAR